MRKYLIIAIAILAGWLVLILLSRMAARHMRGEALLGYRYLIAAIVAIMVMVAGGLLLETGAGRPYMAYQPPRIEGGTVQPGRFYTPPAEAAK